MASACHALTRRNRAVTTHQNPHTGLARAELHRAVVEESELWAGSGSHYLALCPFGKTGNTRHYSTTSAYFACGSLLLAYIVTLLTMTARTARVRCDVMSQLLQLGSKLDISMNDQSAEEFPMGD
jgi:hypothetical protein